MDRGTRWRLSGMMVLLYGVQGSWWPLLAVHLQDLGISDRQRGWIFGTLAIASLAMPLGAGQLVDRVFSTQKYMAVVLGLAALLLALPATDTLTTFVPLLITFLLYWLLAAPCYALSNSLALRHLKNPREQFARVRMWGTIGWLASGWLVTAVMTLNGANSSGQGANEAFAVGAVLAGLTALYCLTLPHTPPLPPPDTVDRPAATATETQTKTELETAIETRRGGVWELLSDPLVVLYLALAMGVSLTTPYVFQVIPSYLELRGLPRPWIATAMTLGQIPEILALAVLPSLLRRLGFRGLLGLGIGAWAMRFGTLSIDPPLWVTLVLMPLQGVAIACFTVGGQMFLDSRAPAYRRATVQSLNMVVTTGVGMLLGSLLAGEITQRAGGPRAEVFMVPCLVNVALLCLLCTGFRFTAVASRVEGATSDTLEIRAGRRSRSSLQAVQFGSLRTESADG